MREAVPSLFIENAEIDDHLVCVRCHKGRIAQIAANLVPKDGDRVVQARGGALLPSLRDNHIHLMALAAQRRSVKCGPPEIESADQLVDALRTALDGDWVRGVGYHESVAGDLTATTIDQWVNDRPVRIQHRSGRLWYLNTVGATALGLPADSQGQLYRKDEELYKTIPSTLNLERDLGDLAKELARFGVTHVTDATPTNSDATAELLQTHCPELDVYAMGGTGLTKGHFKIILDDYRLPEFAAFCRTIETSHNNARPVAIHCVSRVEVVFAVAGLEEAGVLHGDRLEHATELGADVMSQVDALAVEVVPNPNFIFERGDQYVQDNDSQVLESLYPLRSLLARGITCSCGTDAPFGDPNPWLALRAATRRATRDGVKIAPYEAVGPESAYELMSNAENPNRRKPLRVEVDDAANLVILKRPWSDARNRLQHDDVMATVLGGRVTYQST